MMMKQNLRTAALFAGLMLVAASCGSGAVTDEAAETTGVEPSAVASSADTSPTTVVDDGSLEPTTSVTTTPSTAATETSAEAPTSVAGGSDLDRYCEIAQARRTSRVDYLDNASGMPEDQVEEFFAEDLVRLREQIALADADVVDSLILIEELQIGMRDILRENDYDFDASIPALVEMDAQERFEGVWRWSLMYNHQNCGIE